MSNILAKLFTVDAGHKRVFGLDLLRFTAISLVMISHGRIFFQPIFGYDKTQLLNTGGFLGVEMFFVLSGFLIGGILIKICDKEGGLSFESLKDFWRRRWFRTLPNYYLILLVSTIIALAKGKQIFTEFSYYLYFIFSHKLVPGLSSFEFFDESWSLAVEEWFYLTLPLFVIIFLNIGKGIITKQVKYRLLFAIVFLITFGFFIRLLFLIKFNMTGSTVVLLRLDSIIWGVLFAWLNFYAKAWLDSARKYFLIIGLIIIAHSTYVYALGISTGQHGFYFKTFYFTVTDFGFACLLPVCNRLDNVKYGFLSKAVTTVSLVSYSMYLTHVTFAINGILILRKAGFPVLSNFETSVIAGIISFVLYWGITMVISILLFNFYEKPMTQLRDRKQARNVSTAH